MAAPIFSTFTLITEIVITALILYVFYSGYARNKFPKKTAIFALSYETLFNVTYMAMRVFQNAQAGEQDKPLEIMLAIFHGTLSLIMFIALIIFLLFAFRNYGKGINFFKKHKLLTITFIIFWLAAVISGIAFYVLEYVI